MLQSKDKKLYALAPKPLQAKSMQRYALVPTLTSSHPTLFL